MIQGGPPTPPRIAIARMTAEKIDLYTLETPLGENVPMGVAPLPIEKNNYPRGTMSPGQLHSCEKTGREENYGCGKSTFKGGWWQRRGRRTQTPGTWNGLLNWYIWHSRKVSSLMNAPGRSWYYFPRGMSTPAALALWWSCGRQCTR